MNMNEAVTRRLGEMSFSLCEAEAIITVRNQRIAELEARVAELEARGNQTEPAQQMLESR